MAENAVCGFCAKVRDLDSDGTLKPHDTTVPTSKGVEKVQCNGTGRKPMKSRHRK